MTYITSSTIRRKMIAFLATCPAVPCVDPTITVADIGGMGPCSDGWRTFLNGLERIGADTKPGTPISHLTLILAHNNTTARNNWVACRLRDNASRSVFNRPMIIATLELALARIHAAPSNMSATLANVAVETRTILDIYRSGRDPFPAEMFRARDVATLLCDTSSDWRELVGNHIRHACNNPPVFLQDTDGQDAELLIERLRVHTIEAAVKIKDGSDVRFGDAIYVVSVADGLPVLTLKPYREPQVGEVWQEGGQAFLVDSPETVKPVTDSGLELTTRPITADAGPLGGRRGVAWQFKAPNLKTHFTS